MKKRTIGFVVVSAIVVASAGWTYQQSRQEVELSELALENIEALANGELPPNCRGVMNRTCCVIGNTHHIYCEASGPGAETKSCNHTY